MQSPSSSFPSSFIVRASMWYFLPPPAPPSKIAFPFVYLSFRLSLCSNSHTSATNSTQPSIYVMASFGKPLVCFAEDILIVLLHHLPSIFWPVRRAIRWASSLHLTLIGKCLCVSCSSMFECSTHYRRRVMCRRVGGDRDYHASYHLHQPM